MTQALHDLVRHNAWATGQILASCQSLDAARLDATAPGVYGTIIATLRHYIDSEMTYLFRLLGAPSAYPWQPGEAVGLDELTARAALLATTWEQFLAGPFESDRLIEARGRDPERYTVPAGVFLTQALHHGSEHRAQVCTILGGLGHEPPDVSAWGYAFASGRARV